MDGDCGDSPPRVFEGTWTVDFWITVRQKFIITTGGLCYVWAWELYIVHSFIQAKFPQLIQTAHLYPILQ